MKDDVVGYAALYESMLKCKANVLWKASVQHFYLNSIEEVNKLSYELKTGTYKAHPPYKFMVKSPKEREIISICFRDRIYQRSMNDNVIYPTMTKNFIYDNCACQKGKGTDFARKRLKIFLNRFYRENGLDGYVFQIDIKKYYQNIPHSLAIKMFNNKLDPEYAKAVAEILEQQYDGDTGFNPGSQLVQILGISYLNGIDHFIKEKLHVKYYLRYMDDFILFHKDKDYLVYCKNEIEKELAKLGLKYNDKKSRIFKLKDGFDFMGFNYHLTSTGKVIMLVLPSKVKSNMKKYKRLKQRVEKGLISKDKYNESLDCWINHMKKGNDNNLIRRIEKEFRM